MPSLSSMLQQLQELPWRELIAEYVPFVILTCILIHILIVFLYSLWVQLKPEVKEWIKKKANRFKESMYALISVSRFSSSISKLFLRWEKGAAFLRHKLSSFKDGAISFVRSITAWLWGAVCDFWRTTLDLWPEIDSLRPDVGSLRSERAALEAKPILEKTLKFLFSILLLIGKAVLLAAIRVILAVCAFLLTAGLALVFAAVWVISRLSAIAAILLAGISAFLPAAVIWALATGISMLLFSAVWILGFIIIWVTTIAAMLVIGLLRAISEMSGNEGKIFSIATKELVTGAVSLALMQANALPALVSDPVRIRNSTIFAADMQSPSNGAAPKEAAPNGAAPKNPAPNDGSTASETSDPASNGERGAASRDTAPNDGSTVSKTPCAASNGAVAITLDADTKNALKAGMSSLETELPKLSSQMKRVNNCLDVIAKKIESVRQALKENQAAQ